ncbi:MAG TPA: carbamoyltransferase HypF, partial [Vicinamibacterales bacterium]|nr:carbamoyltransferase HypF [Vicinamibacterales bacterium]
MVTACSVRVRGIVQGVGFRPFVFRLAHENTLTGWVNNDPDGVDIHLEGASTALRSFVQSLDERRPSSAVITSIEIEPAEPEGLSSFVIRESRRGDRPVVTIAPDLAICEDCVAELFDPSNCRYRYPYITCTNCGPRYSVIEALPYDRANTTMKNWSLDAGCDVEYRDPLNRRFHAETIACPACGPTYVFVRGKEIVRGAEASIGTVVALIRSGGIAAIKGIGGYHLACDAQNAAAVTALRDRKFRKEKPFALMAGDLESARRLVELTPAAERLLLAPARPIVLAPAKTLLQGVAPDCGELGVMLPYSPLHHLLFAAGAPGILVMTSANRSSEPIAFEDDDALSRLGEIADGFLVGERRIARRVDDSVVRDTACGPAVIRRSRGYGPGVVAALPSNLPILALGADLKNAVTLVVNGQAMVSQHIGDLDQYSARVAFDETIRDLLSVYGIPFEEVIVAHDCHPGYISTEKARALQSAGVIELQHHRAHIASVLAERGAFDRQVLGVSLDGTGYGDDGSIWGGEFFSGSVAEGFERVAHMRPVQLCGGDATARSPVQAAAGFIAQLDFLPDVRSTPFHFGSRFDATIQMARRNVRVFPSTSMGRLFDAAAALLGFTRPVTFEGQAAMWLE